VGTDILDSVSPETIEVVLRLARRELHQDTLGLAGACSGDTGLLVGQALQVGVAGFLPKHNGQARWSAAYARIDAATF
jgi:hypothetical protein